MALLRLLFAAGAALLLYDTVNPKKQDCSDKTHDSASCSGCLRRAAAVAKAEVQRRAQFEAEQAQRERLKLEAEQARSKQIKVLRARMETERAQREQLEAERKRREQLEAQLEVERARGEQLEAQLEDERARREQLEDERARREQVEAERALEKQIEASWTPDQRERLQHELAGPVLPYPEEPVVTQNRGVSIPTGKELWMIDDFEKLSKRFPTSTCICGPIRIQQSQYFRHFSESRGTVSPV